MILDDNGDDDGGVLSSSTNFDCCSASSKSSLKSFTGLLSPSSLSVDESVFLEE